MTHTTAIGAPPDRPARPRGRRLRPGTAALAAAFLLACAGCGYAPQRTTPSPSFGRAPLFHLAATRACLARKGADLGGHVDFVAASAPGGAFATSVEANVVVVAFGHSVAEGRRLEAGYRRVVPPETRRILGEVLRRYDNAVMFWRFPPDDGGLALLTGCLR